MDADIVSYFGLILGPHAKHSGVTLESQVVLVPYLANGGDFVKSGTTWEGDEER